MNSFTLDFCVSTRLTVSVAFHLLELFFVKNHRPNGAEDVAYDATIGWSSAMGHKNIQNIRNSGHFSSFACPNYPSHSVDAASTRDFTAHAVLGCYFDKVMALTLHTGLALQRSCLTGVFPQNAPIASALPPPGLRHSGGPGKRGSPCSTTNSGDR